MSDLGYFAIVSVQQAVGDLDVVLLEGAIPTGQVVPSNLLIYVKKPHDFDKHSGVRLSAEWKDE